MVVDNSGLAVKLAEYVIAHSLSYGNHTLSADAFWDSAFGSIDKPTGVNGCTKAAFLAAVKAGVDAIQ